jgi:hypothetical protein
MLQNFTLFDSASAAGFAKNRYVNYIVETWKEIQYIFISDKSPVYNPENSG